tara:strand:- start:898 stop:1290 length:393 start_codon:yes stop_codon:yes gene_type:complete
MKIYIDLTNQKISDKLFLKEKNILKYSYLVSSEGFFMMKDNKMYKIIVEKDNVFSLDIENSSFIIDDSILEYEIYNKVPFKASELEIEEHIYKLDNTNLHIINDNIYYFECSNKKDINRLYLEICNSILI